MKKILWFSPLAILGIALTGQSANAQGLQQSKSIQEDPCQIVGNINCIQKPKPRINLFRPQQNQSNMMAIQPRYRADWGRQLTPEIYFTIYEQQTLRNINTTQHPN